MYCSVYGCYSNSKKNCDNSLHFFSFPNADKSKDENKRRKTWVEFCKRKGFVPTKNSTICSKHFEADAYVPSCSLQLLNSIKFPGKRKAILKHDALPTINKPEESVRVVKTRPVGALARKKEIDSIMGNGIGGKQSKTVGAKCNDIYNMVENTSSNVSYINDPVSIQYNFAAVSEMGPPVRNKSTQTVTRPSVSNKKSVKSVGTQTFMTMDKISEILFNGMNIAECQSASIGTQTFESEVSETSTSPVIDSALSPSDNQLPLIDEKSSENFSDPIDDYSSDHDEHKKDLDQCEESFDEESESVVDSDDESAAILEEQEKPQKVILSCNKSPQDQQKFIVFEESLVKCFKHCFKCNSECIVSLESTIGTFSQISVNCLNDSNHNFHWSTGPLHNRLPVFHLLITAGILASGLECGKVLRLFDSLEIKCITRREFSTLQSVYAIPAVFNVWYRERNLLLRQIEGTSRCIASDMRVDSPGHTGLFGSGSSMDVEKNVILDTQIIKVLQIAIAHLIMQALTKIE